MSPKGHLVVFAKKPRIGRVKSRLAADIGKVPAWSFYRQTLTKVLRRLEGQDRWHCWIAVTPDQAVYSPFLATNKWRPIGQGDGDLGHRMGRVMQGMPPGPVVIIGTDIPDISIAHITQAFDALGSHACVFGPAADGGYWLVGQKRRPRVIDLFKNVRWSTEHALSDTMTNIPSGRQAAVLETLEDVDDCASFARWQDRRTP
jgi:rSAM/selenodomain-associated transferase 1